MFNELRQWEMSLNNEDLFNIDAALSEEAGGTPCDFFVPPVDFSDLEMFDSVSLSFAIPLNFSRNDSGKISINSIDQLMDPSQTWIEDPEYFNDYPLMDADQTDLLDNVSVGFDPQAALCALQNMNWVDLLDPTRANLEIQEISHYHISSLFSYQGVDLDSYDNVSIKMPAPYQGSDSYNEGNDWPAIFYEIEHYVQNILTEDISDVILSDVHYKPSHSSMTLVKGNGRSQNLFEHGYAKSQNIFSFNEGRESFPQGKSFNLPMQLSMENGELIFKVNLNEIDLRDLSRMNYLPQEMSMKSVLSLIPRKSKAK